MKYLVTVEFKKSGVIEVEADSKNEAKEIVLNSDDFPDDATYVDDSFEVIDIDEVEE